MSQKQEILNTISTEFKRNSCCDYGFMSTFTNATENDVTFGKKVKIVKFKCCGTGMLTAEKENFKAYNGYTSSVRTITTLTLGCSFKYFYKRVAVDGNYSQRLLNYLKADSNSYYDGSSEASGACEAEAKHVAFKHNAKLKGNNIVSTQVLQKDVYVPDVYEVFICKKYVGMMDNGVFKISNQLIEDARYSPAQLKRKRILSWIAVGIISAIIITVLVFVIIDMNTGK